MGKGLLVIALGGNAIKQADERGATEEQVRNVDRTAVQIARIVQEGYRVVLTHGNGPQVGALLIQQEEGQREVPAQSLAVCGAMSQGQIGWMLQNRLAFHLRAAGLAVPVCALVTQVEVSPDDPDFRSPSKPVGPFYNEQQAREAGQSKGWVMRKVKPNGERNWRRVVASPEPLRIVEEEPIRALLAAGTLVIASGGGGIPVARNGDGSHRGLEAVIDKDRAAFTLAQAVGADGLLILTDVEQVCLDFGKPGQRPLAALTVAQAESWLKGGQFLAGSMGPKVDAAVRFVRWSGREAVIGSLDSALDALAGRGGTRVRP